MSSKYDHHSIHHHHHHHHHHHNHHFFRQKTIFLPMFCRLSLKDIKLNHRHNDSTLSDEPSSPKVSCMGQVKRNNRVIGFPAAAAPVTTHHHKYSKLKKLFSSKTLLPPSTSSMSTTTSACAAAAAGGGRSGSKSCRSSREVCMSNLGRLKLKKDGDKCEQGYARVLDIGELDPPLPVVKRLAPPGVGRDEVNIWKRRFNGAALTSLQIEKIHLPNSNSQPPTV